MPEQELPNTRYPGCAPERSSQPAEVEPLRIPAAYGAVSRDLHDALTFCLREQLEMFMGLLAAAANEKPASSPSSEAIEAVRAAHARRLRAAKVLIVDDEEFQRRLLRMQLQRAGCDPANITDAISGQDAVESARRHQFDLAFVDWCMPGYDGIETVKGLRVVAPGLPIVGNSSDTASTLPGQFLAAGARDFVTKPLSALLLKAILLRWILATGPSADADSVLDHLDARSAR